ncbi:MAG: hypothetical protein K1X57_21785, partial [Gemmataceae bacterium]|nr:hypothetical protein [Gemmataceae bacterium]
SPVAGTQNWQSNAWYGTVTNRILDSGVRMDTDPYDGTSLLMADVINYVSDFTNPNPYMVGLKFTTQPAWVTTGPDPKIAAAHLMLGGMVNLHISWFKLQSGVYKRDGGHSVSFIGATGLCSGPIHVRYRDPGSNDANNSQSAFATSDSAVHPVGAQFAWDFGDTSPHPGVIYQLDDYTGQTKGFLTGISVLMVNFGLGIETSTQKLVLTRPLGFAREMLPAVQSYDLDGAKVSDVQLLPHLTQAMALTDGAEKIVHLIDLASGEHKPFFPVDSIGPLALGRMGDIFYCDGSVLKSFDPQSGKIARKVTVDSPLVHMVYDDAIDEVVGLDPARRRLQQYNRLLQRTYDRALPDGLSLGVDSSIAMHPITHQLWVSAGDGSVFELRRPRAGGLTMQRFTLPGIERCRSLQFLPDGALTVLCDGSVREFRADPDGKLVPSDWTGFDGEKFDGVFRLAQSRNDTASWNEHAVEPDVDPPAEKPAESPDCVGDYDLTGFVDTDDFTAFVLDFEAGVLRADVDYTGFVDTDDFTYFVLAFENGC